MHQYGKSFAWPTESPERGGQDQLRSRIRWRTGGNISRNPFRDGRVFRQSCCGSLKLVLSRRRHQLFKIRLAASAAKFSHGVPAKGKGVCHRDSASSIIRM